MAVDSCTDFIRNGMWDRNGNMRQFDGYYTTNTTTTTNSNSNSVDHQSAAHLSADHQSTGPWGGGLDPDSDAGRCRFTPGALPWLTAI